MADAEAAMNILLLTNTYVPHVGGVARSITAFEEEYRRAGHQVLTVAPEFDGPAEDNPNVVRVPALKHFQGSDFSVPIPIPGLLTTAINDFKPDIVHSHHPFLMGDTAIRIAWARKLPIVFTHHTMYDQYTHYMTGEANTITQFVVSLTNGYANLCDAVIAPSQSIAEMLRSRGVVVPVEVIPTGVDTKRFGRGDGPAIRRELNIPADAFVVGHVGRLAAEKNLTFLAEAVAKYLGQNEQAHFLVVGSGSCEEVFQATFAAPHLASRLHMLGTCEGQRLVDAYHAMTVFAFSSVSETQGMVLAEAMAAGLPVVALDGPGVREILVDCVNGRMLLDQNSALFSDALQWIERQSEAGRQSLRQAALATARRLSMPRTAQQALDLYEQLIAKNQPRRRMSRGTSWGKAKRRLEAEWTLLSNVAHAAGSALESPDSPALQPTTSESAAHLADQN